MTASEYYQLRLVALEKDLKNLRSRKSLIGWMRFGTIALLVVLFYFLWNLGWIYPAGVGTLLLILFTRLVFADLRTRDRMIHLEHLATINRAELEALRDNFSALTGAPDLSAKNIHTATTWIFLDGPLSFSSSTAAAVSPVQLISLTGFQHLPVRK